MKATLKKIKNIINNQTFMIEDPKDGETVTPCMYVYKSKIQVKCDMRYADYFPEYAQYFGRALKLLKSMYGMTNTGKLFADELK